MESLLLIVSVLLIAIVLLQSGKSGAASSIITGAGADLFSNRKERGGEKFMTRLTGFLGILFFLLCLVMSF